MITVEWRRDDQFDSRGEVWDMYVDDEFEGWVLKTRRGRWCGQLVGGAVRVRDAATFQEAATPLVRELRAGLERGAA
jgi:hypothetical protein